jgi:hypothetical protein
MGERIRQTVDSTASRPLHQVAVDGPEWAGDHAGRGRRLADAGAAGSDDRPGEGGKPDVLLMSKRTRRKLKSLLTASAHYVESGESSFGRQLMLCDGITVLASDFTLDNEAADNGSGSTFSSIYALHVSPAHGLVGLTNGGLEVIDVGSLETKDASRVRVRWYVGLAVLRDSAVARMNGVSVSADGRHQERCGPSSLRQPAVFHGARRQATRTYVGSTHETGKITR